MSNCPEAIFKLVVPEIGIDVLAEPETVCHLIEGFLRSLLFLVVRIPVSERYYTGQCLVSIFSKGFLSFISVIYGLPACSESELSHLQSESLGNIAGIFYIMICHIRVDGHICRSLDAESVVSDTVLELIPYCSDIKLQLGFDLVYQIALIFFVIFKQFSKRTVFDFSFGEASAGISFLYYGFVVFHYFTSTVFRNDQSKNIHKDCTIHTADFQSILYLCIRPSVLQYILISNVILSIL